MGSLKEYPIITTLSFLGCELQSLFSCKITFVLFQRAEKFKCNAKMNRSIWAYKHLQWWWNLHVVVSLNGRHILYFARHKANISLDAVLVLLLALVSRSLIAHESFVFCCYSNPIFHIFNNNPFHELYLFRM